MKRLIVLIIAAMMIMTQVCAAAPAGAESADSEAAVQEAAESAGEEAAAQSDAESAGGESAESGAAAQEGAEQPASAEEAVEGEEESEEEDGLGAGLLEEYLAGPELDHMTIGNPNPLGGKFFTDMWGNITSDQDVRDLLFAYDLIYWDNGVGGFEADPGVVTGIVVTEDTVTGNRTYTMALYDDMYYSDGTQVTAWDYGFSFLLTTSPLISELGGTPDIKQQIVGYQDYVDGTVPYLAGVRVLSDDTIAITVSGDYLPFFYELALVSCKPYPISVIAPGVEVRDDGQGVYLANIDDTITEDLFTADLLRETILDEETGYLSHPSVVSGPYVLTSWDGEVAEFEINEYFKGKYAKTTQKDEEGEELLDADGNPITIEYLATPTVKTLTVKTAYYDTMIKDLENGDFDLLNKLTNGDAITEGMQLVRENVDEEGYSEFLISNYPRVGLSYISLACEEDGLSEQAVRQAIAWCMDRDEIMNAYVGAGLGLRVDGYYGIGQWMYLLVNDPDRLEAPGEDAAAEDTAKYEETKAGLEGLAKIDEETGEATWTDEMTAYTLDLEEAKSLLAAAGWTKNEAGICEKKVRVPAEEAGVDPADPQVAEDGTVEKVMTLEFTMLYPEESTIAEAFEEFLVPNLEEVGIRLTLQPAALGDLLRQLYYPEEREADMFYLASNLDIVFDPALFFTTEVDEVTGQERHIWTITGLEEENLYQAALAMRETEPGDVLSYCQHWVDFQYEFNKVLPMIPVYSNVYADIYSGHLHDYAITENATWSEAIITANLQQDLVNSTEEEEETESEEELEEGEVIFGD